MGKLRMATFNVENLFERSKVLNFQNNEVGDQWLGKIDEFRSELKKPRYDGARIVELYHELKEFIDVVEVRKKLFNRAKTEVVADGVNAWGGFISFKRERFSDAARANTARVIRTVDADVCCLIEVESRPVLQHFCIDQLPKRGRFVGYPYQLLIDGNDNRGIDVALASRLPIGAIRTHIYDMEGRSKIFSRDCLELELQHASGPIYLLINHFKSKGYGRRAQSNARRKAQALRVAEILRGYDLSTDRVVVAGDLNDSPDSDPLSPLRSVSGLFDVLETTFDNQADRWTYHFRKNEQIDYLMVSKPLHDVLLGAGVERRGIWGVDRYTNGAVTSFDTVSKPSEAASDHGAVWADFDL